MMFFFGPFFFLLPLAAFLIIARILAGFFGRELHDAGRKARLEGSASSAPQPRSQGRLESRVIALAYRLGGRVTVSDVVIETGLGIREAEGLMDRMTDEVRVRMNVDDRGLVSYDFPEIMDRLDRERQ